MIKLPMDDQCCTSDKDVSDYQGDILGDEVEIVEEEVEREQGKKEVVV